jgi:hypothetical protein
MTKFFWSPQLWTKFFDLPKKHLVVAQVILVVRLIMAIDPMIEFFCCCPKNFNHQLSIATASD